MPANDDFSLEFHECCTMFRDMNAEEMDGLIDSIDKHGQAEPILTFRGKIIDGKNRYRACEACGIKPITKEWEGEEEDIPHFVMAKNVERRHLSTSEKTAAGAVYKTIIEKTIRHGNPNFGTNAKVEAVEIGNLDKQPAAVRNAIEEAAKAVGVSARSINKAEQVLKASPEKFQEVKDGKTTVNQARRDLGLDKPKNPRKPKDKPVKEAKAKPTGQTRLNGKVVPDPDYIAEKRAAGLIAADAVPDITDTDADPEDAVAAAKDDQGEQNGRVDDLSDDDWLATLPLSSKLTGACLKTFQADAVGFRHLAAARRSFKHHASRETKAAKRKGAYLWAVDFFLAIEPPEKWLLCPPTDAGGCKGTGQVEHIGECQMCRGRGYRLNRGND